MFVTCKLSVKVFKNSGKNPANPVESGLLLQACNPVPAKMIKIRSGSGWNRFTSVLFVLVREGG